MNLCNDYKQVTISSTDGGSCVLSTASGTRVLCLNRLEVASDTTAATWTLRVQSITTATTAEVTGTLTYLQGETACWPMERTVEGCIRGRVGGNLQLTGSTAQLMGAAIVSWTTEPAT